MMAGCGDAREAVPFERLGLRLAYPDTLEPPAPAGTAPAPDLIRAMAGDAAGHATEDEAGHVAGDVAAPYHVALRAPRPRGLRLEIHIDREPAHPRTALALARGLRHGASLQIAEVARERIGGQSWQRTRFSHVTGDGRETGIEYAARAGRHLYRVTAYGPDGPATALAAQVAPTLRLRHAPGQDLGALHAPAHDAPAAVQRAAGAVVAVLAANLAPDRAPALAPAAMGSGVVLDAQGHVLTSLHTLHDQARDALHDLFLVARSRPDGGLVFVCAGRPARGRLDRTRDLALIRCERDMSGVALEPTGWPALAPGPAPATGTRLWALGYAEADDGALRARAGTALGPSRPDADPEQNLAVDAPIAPGMSGGAVVDEHGALIAVVQGFRERFRASREGTRVAGRIGLVRSVEHLGTLLRAR